MITIELKDGTPAFIVPKEDLVNQSDYFDRLLNGPFSETQTKVLHFGNDEGDVHACAGNTFKLFLYWIYKEKLPEPRHAYERIHDHDYDDDDGIGYLQLKTSNPEKDIYEPMILLWGFADRYLIPDLQADIMCYLLVIGIDPHGHRPYISMFERITDGITTDLTALIFDVTLKKHSPLRQWIVKLWGWKLFDEEGFYGCDDPDCNQLSTIEDFWGTFFHFQYPMQPRKYQPPSEE